MNYVQRGENRKRVKGTRLPYTPGNVFITFGVDTSSEMKEKDYLVTYAPILMYEKLRQDLLAYRKKWQPEPKESNLLNPVINQFAAYFNLIFTNEAKGVDMLVEWVEQTGNGWDEITKDAPRAVKNEVYKYISDSTQAAKVSELLTAFYYGYLAKEFISKNKIEDDEYATLAMKKFDRLLRARFLLGDLEEQQVYEMFVGIRKACDGYTRMISNHFNKIYEASVRTEPK